VSERAWGTDRRAAFARRTRVTGTTEEGTAAGVYGVIIGAAVMASSHAGSAAAVIVAVVVTLVVYWSAERYARLLAARIHDGRTSVRHHMRAQLTSGWEIVTASALPVAVLAVLRLTGVSLDRAVIGALTCSALLLCRAGWEMGGHGGLTHFERIASTAIAGAFGLVMILLKIALH
jgi:hypothetical protein